MAFSRFAVTNDFFPNKAIFHLSSATGEMLDIKIEELKAVYFVKRFEGDKDRIDDYTDDIPGGGRKVQVMFSDGEMLIPAPVLPHPANTHQPGMI